MSKEASMYVGQVSEHALIFNEFGEVFLLLHAGKGCEALRGLYHLPGGRMEKEDKPGIGLLREIAEETGLQNVELILPCSATRWGVDTPAFGKKYSVLYLARVQGRPTPVLPDEEDHMGAEWVPYTEVAGKTFIFEGMQEAIAEAGRWAMTLGVLKHGG